MKIIIANAFDSLVKAKKRENICLGEARTTLNIFSKSLPYLASMRQEKPKLSIVDFEISKSNC